MSMRPIFRCGERKKAEVGYLRFLIALLRLIQGCVVIILFITWVFLVC